MSQEAELLRRAITVEIDRDVGKHYLVVTLGQQERLITHQVVMLNCFLHPKVITPEERSYNNQMKLYYQLKERLSLRYYLDKEKIDSSMVLKILDKIVGLLLESKNFFLYPASFLLHEEHIFINPTTGDVSLVYLPLKLGGEANENFKGLLKRVSFYYGDFFAELVGCCEERSFALQDVREWIKKREFLVENKEESRKHTVKAFQLNPNSVVKPANLLTEERESFVVQKKVRRLWGIDVNGVAIFVLLQLVFIVALLMFSAYFNLVGLSSLDYASIFFVIVLFNLLILKKVFKL